MATTMSNTALQDSGNRSWRLAAIALLAIRFVQGWIYWGGGTRRFIYGPQKLDVHDHWMAYKFQTSMPGDAWIARVKPDDPQHALDHVKTGLEAIEALQAWIKRYDVQCMRCSD